MFRLLFSGPRFTTAPDSFTIANYKHTQECKECEFATFLISSEHGCRAQLSGQEGWLGGCDNRACITCADGATCNKGSTALWQHFVPKPLQLGGRVLPWVSVIHGGNTVRLFCDQESMTCAPPSAAGSATAGPGLASGDDHIWEFSEEISHFVLKRCPPGHRLVSSSSEGVLNPTLQLCSACGPNTYIIDQYAPSCQPCPRGASCPDGAQFLPTAVGSVWENVFDADGGIQKRIIECPPGEEYCFIVIAVVCSSWSHVINSDQ